MISTSYFKKNIVDIFVERFGNTPESLVDAFGVIWSIDAYATHASAHLNMNENTFKNLIVEEGGWEFRLLWEASNATKHAIVRNEQNRDVRRSDSVHVSELVDGAAAYFSNSQHSGKQICIKVAWKLDESTNIWHDAEGKIVIGGGPFFNIVPVFDLIKPTLETIEIKLR